MVNGRNQDGKRSELEKAIRAEAERNPEFLEDLKKNPHEALRKKFQLEIPQHIKIQCHVEEPNSWHIVVSGVSTPSQMSEKDMKDVAGGDCWV